LTAQGSVFDVRLQGVETHACGGVPTSDANSIMTLIERRGDIESLGSVLVSTMEGTATSGGSLCSLCLISSFVFVYKLLIRFAMSSS
jgi:hypothetical protein